MAGSFSYYGPSSGSISFKDVQTSTNDASTAASGGLATDTLGKFIPMTCGNIVATGRQIWSSSVVNPQVTGTPVPNYNDSSGQPLPEAPLQYVRAGTGGGGGAVDVGNSFSISAVDVGNTPNYQRSAPSASSGQVQFTHPVIVSAEATGAGKTSYDVAYSFGYNLAPGTSRKLLQVKAGATVIYDANDSNLNKYNPVVHYGDEPTPDATIQEALKDNALYYPDQCYIVLKGVPLASVPKELTGKFATIYIQGSGITKEYLGLSITDVDAINMPDFPNQILYVYVPPVTAGKGRIDKYDMVTTEKLQSINVEFDGPDARADASTLQWLPSQKVMAFQAAGFAGDEPYFSKYSNNPVIVVDVETAQEVTRVGKLLVRQPNTPFDPANGPPTLGSVYSVRKADDSARYIGRPLGQNRERYRFDIVGLADSGLFTITYNKDEDFAGTDSVRYITRADQGTTYYIIGRNLYKYDGAETLIKTFAMDEINLSLAEMETYVYLDRVLLISSEFAYLINPDGTYAYKKEFPVPNNLDRFTGNIIQDAKSGTIVWNAGATRAGIFEIATGTVRYENFAEVSPDNVGNAYDSTTQRVWGWTNTRFLQLPPTVTGNFINLSDFIRACYVLSGKYTANQIQFDDIEDLILGAGIFAPRKLGEIINDVTRLFRISKYEQDGVIRFYRNKVIGTGQLTIRAVIPIEMLALAAENGDPQAALTIENLTVAQSKGQIDLNFIDPDADFAQNTVTYRPPDAPAEATETLTLTVPLVLQKERALSLLQLLSIDGAASETNYKFRLPISLSYLGQGDIIQITDRKYTYTMSITEDTYNGDFSLTCLAEGISTSQTADITIPDKPTNATDDTSAKGSTFGAVFDVPTLLAEDDLSDNTKFSVYSVIYGATQDWISGYMARLDQQFELLYSTSRTVPVYAYKATEVMGTSAWEIDRDGMFCRSVYNIWNIENNTTIEEMLDGVEVNIALYGLPGRWEIVHFASIVSGRVTGIMRGLRGTEMNVGNHRVGDLFIPVTQAMIKEDRPVGLIATDSSQTYKAVSLGQSLTSAARILTPVRKNSLRPWAPVNVKIAVDSGNLNLSWLRRDRKGKAWGFKPLPLSEVEEKYTIKIKTSTGIRTVANLTQPSYVYSSAEMAVDGNSADSKFLDLEVFQQSAEVGDGLSFKGKVYV